MYISRIVQASPGSPVGRIRDLTRESIPVTSASEDAIMETRPDKDADGDSRQFRNYRSETTFYENGEDEADKRPEDGATKVGGLDLTV